MSVPEKGQKLQKLYVLFISFCLLNFNTFIHLKKNKYGQLGHFNQIRDVSFLPVD